MPAPAIPDTISRAEFVRQADQICYSAELQIEASADELANAPGKVKPEQVAEVARGVVAPALEAEVSAIEALGAPAGDEDRVRAILEATERGIEQIEAAPGRLSDGPPPALREAQRLAEAYGSEQCGFGSR